MFGLEFLKVLCLYEDARRLIAVAAAFFFLAAVLSYVLKRTGVYVAFAFVLVGACILTTIYGDLSIRAGLVCLALIALLGGGIYCILIFAIAVFTAIQARKRKKREVFRRLEYTLPERSNTFVRTRLNTALQAAEEGREGQKPPIKLCYVRRLLTELKNAPLTMAERLQTEELNAALAAYLQKSEWSTNDIRAVNEMCSAVLKLSAKYNI